jgi:hypothetical protein
MAFPFVDRDPKSCVDAMEGEMVVLELIIQSCSKKERSKVSGVDNSVDKIVFVLFAFEKLRKKQM